MASRLLRSDATQSLVLAIAVSGVLSCSGGGGGGDSGSSSESTDTVTSSGQPGDVAIDTSGQSNTAVGNGNGGTGSTQPKVAVSGNLAVTDDPGMSLLGSGASPAGMYVKAMTADTENQATCLNMVNAVTGNFSLECEGFQKKQLVVAVISQNSDGSSDLLALKLLGGISENTTSVTVDLILDRDTGTLQAKNFVQSRADSVISPSSFKVAVADFFKSLVVKGGLYSFYQTHVSSDADKKKVLAGDYSTLPSYATRTSPGAAWRQTMFSKFIPSDGFSAPRLQLWADAAKATACSATGYAITDGSNSLTDITFVPTLAAIKARNWAPQSVLDRYQIASRLDQGSNLHDNSVIEGRRLVEEFYQQLSKSRRMHSPDITKSLLANAYTALTLETSIDDVADETLKVWAYMLIDHQFVAADRRLILQAALASFSAVDPGLGGTGKSVLQHYVKNFMLASGMYAAGIKVYGGNHSTLNTALDLAFAQEAKAINTDAATESDLDAAIAKLQNADSSQQNQGSLDVHAFLSDIDFSANIINDYCYDAERFDFTRVVGDPAGRAALATFNSKVNLTYPPSLKGGVPEPLFQVVGSFVSAIAPVAGGCSQHNLTAQYAWSQRAIWNPGTQSYDLVTNDAMRDIGGKDTILYMWNWLLDLRRRAAIYGFDLRDPNGDTVAAFSPAGVTNASYSGSNAQDDFDALAAKILVLVGYDDQYGGYQYLCNDLAKSGFDVSGQSQCFSPMAVPAAALSYTSAQKLAKLQAAVEDLVAREAYGSDPAFLAKMNGIYKNSTCPPDVSVSWDKDAAAASPTAFAIEVKGPVYRILDGEITAVAGPNGSPTLVVDGSQLQTGKVWIPSQSAEKNCAYGDVKFLRNLKFESDDSLESFVFENGFKDTCYDPSSGGGSDYVDQFFVDVTPPL